MVGSMVGSISVQLRTAVATLEQACPPHGERRR